MGKSIEMLDAWLDRHNARCMWQRRTAAHKGANMAEGWLFPNGSLAVVVRYNGGGWDIFVQMGRHTNVISDVLGQAEVNLELRREEAKDV